MVVVLWAALVSCSSAWGFQQISQVQRAASVRFHNNHEGIPTTKPRFIPQRQSVVPHSSALALSPATAQLVANLPVCTSQASAVSLALKSGATAVVLQRFLQRLCRSSRSKVLQDTAEYTAHSIVAMGLMILLSSTGVLGWWLPFFLSSNPVANGMDRLLGVSDTGRWMAAVVFGCFALWDIPTSLRVKALRKPDVMVHHGVMMVLAGLGCTVLPMHYILYYFGVVELSSIPLIAYDQVVHWMEHSKSKESSENTKTKSSLEPIQGALGIIAALAFTSIRVISFTKVTLTNFLPDCRTALATALLSSQQKWTIRFLMLACGGFTFLQWYWFSKMVTAFRNDAV